VLHVSNVVQPLHGHHTLVVRIYKTV